MEYRVDWVAKYGKMGEKLTFWAFSGNLYWYTLDLYRYSPPEPNLYRYRCGTGEVHPTMF